MDGAKIFAGAKESLIAEEMEDSAVNKSPVFRLEKRLFDIVASGLGLVIL